jgi:GDP-mannose 6-dehydrogenase
MKILVVGMGTVGKSTAAGFSKLGHSVECCDLGDNPPASDVCFVCVPEIEVPNAVKYIETGCLVVRSTTIPGTVASLGHVCHNPSFVREASAIEDFDKPDMVLIGECCKYHGDILADLYSVFPSPIVRTDPTTSEIVKLTLNAYLTIQITFWNEINLITKKLNISASVVSDICKKDHRVSCYGDFYSPFGGKCLSKDVKQMCNLFESHGVEPELFNSVIRINGMVAR